MQQMYLLAYSGISCIIVLAMAQFCCLTCFLSPKKLSTAWSGNCYPLVNISFILYMSYTIPQQVSLCVVLFVIYLFVFTATQISFSIVYINQRDVAA